ncbi:hypothetical protein GO730_15560 [Spirosoma sp. HMF3257]|uniref:Uncharacterized protein n=1 Tax=Spirosoma telluris TaxID=2183553 RepID=A0A327NMV9_9BACT|nr:hypothetical protein [Spirosoma telluris]RAI75244.1 hypothetical protein HMF3257_15505 [Spirosoma telluris]
MITEQRIDRLTLQMIELSQKLEGQAQMLTVFKRLDQNMDTTAESLANLTIKTSRLADEQAEFRQEVNRKFEEVIKK